MVLTGVPLLSRVEGVPTWWVPGHGEGERLGVPWCSWAPGCPLVSHGVPVGGGVCEVMMPLRWVAPMVPRGCPLEGLTLVVDQCGDAAALRVPGAPW